MLGVLTLLSWVHNMTLVRASQRSVMNVISESLSIRSQSNAH